MSGGGDSTALLDLDGFASALVSPPEPQASHRPWLLRLRSDERTTFERFCHEQRLTIIDEIERQVVELVSSRKPSSRWSEDDRRREVGRLLGAPHERAALGNWVYLPWEAKVVHLLAEDDYFEVITSRNRDKITREEQLRLRSKAVGVMGLSVGAEAAVALAQEHLAGEIVLADFDRLELSNMNRIHAGFDDLGLPKTVLAARRIAKIDPYLRVRILPGGITPDVVESFLDGLDLIVEECDDLSIKREVRFVARERRINIVFAADERGFLSVEPYALWPDLEPFHGRVAEAQRPKESYSTPLEFLKALSLWLGGWDALSERSQRSLERVGTELGGYPQLASEARFAAGQIGQIARRLLLGERIPPYLGNLDLDAIVPTGA